MRFDGGPRGHHRNALSGIGTHLKAWQCGIRRHRARARAEPTGRGWAAAVTFAEVARARYRREYEADAHRARPDPLGAGLPGRHHRQMLSKIENAQTSASLATVDALARGLEVPVTSLFRAADHETQSVFSKSGQAPETVRRGSNLGHRYQLLGQLTRRHGLFEPLLVTLTD